MKPTHKSRFSKTLLPFLLLLPLLFGCGGGEDDPKPNPDPGPSRQELVARERGVSTVSFDGQQVAAGSYTIRFHPGGTFEFNTPGIPGLPQSGDWSLNPGGTLIILNGSVELQIIGELTPTRFVFEYTYTNHKMGEVKVRFTLA